MFTVAAFYKFAPITDPVATRAAILEQAEKTAARGSVLIATEGVNGTIAGPEADVMAVLDMLRGLPGFSELTAKFSTATEMPFGRLKVRLKREIVTMGQPQTHPGARVGTYVAPSDWNALISAPDVVVIDTRNDYEVAIGTFRGAIDPDLQSFTEFPEWWRSNRDRFHNKRVAMFCTGGIRCEKSTSFALEDEDAPEVFHLDGGILAYLEHIPEENSLWDGECFVFDQRVSLGHGLVEGTFGMCHACRRPVSDADRQSAVFEDGVQCPACVDEYSDADRARFRERHRQMKLAEQRGERHMA